MRKLVDLSRVPTAQLTDELARRAARLDRYRDAKPRRYCDVCQMFTCSREQCDLGHKIRFRVPDDMGEAVRSECGWYRPGGCRQFVAEGSK